MCRTNTHVYLKLASREIEKHFYITVQHVQLHNMYNRISKRATILLNTERLFGVIDYLRAVDGCVASVPVAARRATALGRSVAEGRQKFGSSLKGAARVENSVRHYTWF